MIMIMIMIMMKFSSFDDSYQSG